MRYLVTFLFLIFFWDSFSQETLVVQCTDRRSGRKLNSQNISDGSVLLKKFDGTTQDYGPILNGQFEIDKNCHRGDKFTIIVDEGDYEGYSFYCTEIKRFGNKFPLFKSEDYRTLTANLDLLNDESFSDVKVKNASVAFIANTVAYINRNENKVVYNTASKKMYLSLGSVFEVENPVTFDESQDLWVATPELEIAIKAFKTEKSLENVNGQADYAFFNALTGLNALEVYKPAQVIYEKVEVSVSF